MRRYQYRLNDQNVAYSKWSELQPLKYMEVVPGDTIGGTISVKATSAITEKVIHSRAYYDLYAFYCPIRVLWEQFPEYLAGAEGGVSTPVTTTLMPENFESSWLGNDGVTVDGQGVNAPFLRRMYYMVAYSFFHPDKASGGNRQVTASQDAVRAGDFDNETFKYWCAARESTFDESWLDADSTAHDGTSIKVTDGEIQLDQIRRAYSLDRYEKIRDYYGARYTDLLRGYGIKADWGILQEPECIGISNNDFRFVQKNRTDSQVGERNGYFEGEYKIKLRKTFCPEHGIIGVFAVPRADVFNQTQGGHILLSRNLQSPTSWYDPHTWDQYPQQTFPKAILDSGHSRGTRASTPLAEHMRKGRNEIAVPAGTDWDELPVFSKSMTPYLGDHNTWKKNACTPLNSEVREADPKITVSAGRISHYSEVRVAKRSPIKPSGATILQGAHR